MSERETNEIGALWLKQSKKGTKYLSGTVNGQAIVIFRNQNKRSEKAPDYRILKSEPLPAKRDPEGWDE